MLECAVMIMIGGHLRRKTNIEESELFHFTRPHLTRKMAHFSQASSPFFIKLFHFIFALFTERSEAVSSNIQDRLVSV